jgi:hypothetical protein
MVRRRHARHVGVRVARSARVFVESLRRVRLLQRLHARILLLGRELPLALLRQRLDRVSARAARRVRRRQRAAVPVPGDRHRRLPLSARRVATRAARARRALRRIDHGRRRVRGVQEILCVDKSCQNPSSLSEYNNFFKYLSVEHNTNTTSTNNFTFEKFYSSDKTSPTTTFYNHTQFPARPRITNFQKLIRFFSVECLRQQKGPSFDLEGDDLLPSTSRVILFVFSGLCCSLFCFFNRNRFFFRNRYNRCVWQLLFSENNLNSNVDSPFPSSLMSTDKPELASVVDKSVKLSSFESVLFLVNEFCSPFCVAFSSFFTLFNQNHPALMSIERQQPVNVPS